MTNPMNTDWEAHIWATLRTRAGLTRIEKHGLSRPQDAGFYLSTGLPKGQLLDYRWAMPNGRGIHVLDFGTHYEMHWDRVDPSVSLAGHLVQDAPIVLKIGGLAAGAALWWWANRNKSVS